MFVGSARSGASTLLTMTSHNLATLKKIVRVPLGICSIGPILRRPRADSMSEPREREKNKHRCGTVQSSGVVK
jgi:hypothetical protein